MIETVHGVITFNTKKVVLEMKVPISYNLYCTCLFLKILNAQFLNFNRKTHLDNVIE